MEGRIVKAALEEMIARELSWRNDLFHLLSALLATNDWNTHAVERMVERRRGEATLHERQIDRKIGPKSSQNRAKIASGALGAILGNSGAFGDAPGTLRDAPGELPGRPQSASEAPGTVPGRSETLPGRSGMAPRHVGTSNERPRPRENGKNVKIVFSLIRRNAHF